jgi:hypothetical protein
MLRNGLTSLGARAAAAILLVFAVLLPACAETTRHKVLTTLFDGVPEREEASTSESAGDAGPEVTPGETVKAEEAADPVERWEPSGAPLESATSWEEALVLLPGHPAGGVDWVAALDEGLYEPRAIDRAGIAAAPAAPSSTDLVALGSHRLDLRVVFEAPEAPLFKADFSHSTHNGEDVRRTKLRQLPRCGGVSDGIELCKLSRRTCRA